MTVVKVTPKELIAKRENLISDIKKNWDRIKVFNTTPKGVESHYDVKEVYKLIAKDSADLVKTKVAIQAINMGLKNLSELSEDNLYSLIYTLQQLKEQRIKLNLVPTSADSAISRAFIQAELKKLDTEIAKIGIELEERNSNINFTL